MIKSFQQIEELSRIFKALSDPVRLRILQELLTRECGVGDLVAISGCSQPNVSRHLSVLSSAGLVGRRSEGVRVLYRVVRKELRALCELACGLGEGIARERYDVHRGSARTERASRRPRK